MAEINNTVCDLEPFVYDSIPQPEGESGSSSNRLNEQQLQEYLARMLTAMCETLQSIQAKIEEIEEQLP